MRSAAGGRGRDKLALAGPGRAEPDEFSVREVALGAGASSNNRGGFWSKRQKINVERSIPTMREQLENHGRMDNYRRLVERARSRRKGRFIRTPTFTNGLRHRDCLQSGDIPKLHSLTASMIKEVVAVQEPSGYLNTYYIEDKVSQRMLTPQPGSGHELYNLGHMIQGGIAYYRATGDSTLMDVGAKMVDRFSLA